MSRIDSLDTLLVEELRDIYDAERRLTKAIPKMIKAATSEDLSTALEGHLTETEKQITRLEEAFGLLGETPSAKPCAGMRGIIEEGEEHLDEEYDEDSLRDAAIIGSAQRVEHYEMAAYGTAIAHARMIHRDDVADLLDQSLVEEKNADERLTEVAETCVNAEAASDEDESAAEDRASSRTRAGNGARARSTRGRSRT